MAVKKRVETKAKGAGKPPVRKATGQPATKATTPVNKTQPTRARVADFIATVPDARRRQEAKVVLEMMRSVTGLEPMMWGPSIIGFGSYHYRYESGREGDMCRTGFSPRKAALTLYLMGGSPRYQALLQRLGRYTTSVSCLYIKRLEDVDLGVLEEMIRVSWEQMAVRYPAGR